MNELARGIWRGHKDDFPMNTEFSTDDSPYWLNLITKENIECGVFPIREILSGSLFYPASGMDGSPVRHWKLGVDSFVYVDALIPESSYISEIQGRAFKGYGLMGYRKLSPSDLIFNGWQPRIPASIDPDLYRRAMESLMSDRQGPFAMWSVFERLPQQLEQHGPKRFSLLHVRAEACATYQALYVAGGVLPKIIALVRPGFGFGRNFNNFDVALLETMQMHADGLPAQLLSWHPKGAPQSADDNFIQRLYPNLLLSSLSKDDDPSFEISLFSRN